MKLPDSFKTGTACLVLGVCAATSQPRPRVEPGKVPERSARWENPQPVRRTSEPVKMESNSGKTDKYDRGRVADHVYPDVKWNGGQHTRRFNENANPSPPPGKGRNGGGGNGGKNGGSSPPPAPAPKP